ncbi:hypothetical protein B5F53_13750 [Blautia sp. An249]|nr:hypothetical protein B5F53_13750 [Blautia sp. An249]
MLEIKRLFEKQSFFVPFCRTVSQNKHNKIPFPSHLFNKIISMVFSVKEIQLPIQAAPIMKKEENEIA